MTKLTPEHMKAIELIVSGMKYVDVAEELDRNVRTVYAWLKEETFDRELKAQIQMRKSAALTKFDEVHDALVSVSEQAASVLEEILSNPEVSDGVRAATAIKVLAMVGHKAPDKIDLNQKTTEVLAMVDPEFDREQAITVDADSEI